MRTIKRGEIYFADLNPVRGSEQGGIRPVLVIQNNTGNHFSPTVIIAPITSSLDKSKLPTHVSIATSDLSQCSIVLLEQIRTIDKSRISDYITRLDDNTMTRISRAAAISVDIKKEVLLNE